MFSLAGLQKGLRSTFDMMGGSGTQKHATETSAAGVNESGEIIEESQGKKRLNILKKKAFIMFTEDENLRQYSSSNKVGDSPYAPMEPIPTSIFKKPYWQLRCIETTMKTGGFLNPDLFLPKQAWDQSHLKIAGYSAKMSAFQAILLLLNEVQLTFSEITSTSPDKIYNTVSNLVEEFRGIQNQLTQPFSFIPAVTVTNPPAEDSEEAEAQVSNLFTIHILYCIRIILYYELTSYHRILSTSF